MPSEKLEQAIGAIHVRFGDQALVRGGRLLPVEAWSTGLPVIDRLSGIGGLPRGRISLLQGGLGSGKVSMAMALLATASQEHARVVVIDHRSLRFDPWIPDLLGADLKALTVVRPPTAAAAGEAAWTLVAAGVGFALVLDELPDVAVMQLESVAARTGSMVLAVTDGQQRPLAHASSLTLELERVRWVQETGLMIGLRSRVSCVKNKVSAPGTEAEVVMRYPLAPKLPKMTMPAEVEVDRTTDQQRATDSRSAVS